MRWMVLGSLCMAAVVAGIIPQVANAASVPGCSGSCELFDNKVMLQNDRITISGKTWHSTSSGRYVGATITDYEDHDDYCYQDHNKWIEWNQYGSPPTFLDRDPNTVDGSTSSTSFSISLSGPSVGWAPNSGSAFKWKLIESGKQRTSGENWYGEMNHNLFSHGRGDTFNRDTFGFSVDASGTSGVYLMEMIRTGTNCWNPPWHSTGWHWMSMTGGSSGSCGDTNELASQGNLGLDCGVGGGSGAAVIPPEMVPVVDVEGAVMTWTDALKLCANALSPDYCAPNPLDYVP